MTSSSIAVLVIDQDTKVSQRVTLCPETDLVSYVDLLASLEQQLGPLFETKRESNNNNNNSETNSDGQNSEDVDRITLPPESTNLLVFDREIGTYVPLSDPPSTCIRDKSRLLIDLVPPSPAAIARRRLQQQQQRDQEQRRGASNNENDDDDEQPSNNHEQKALFNNNESRQQQQTIVMEEENLPPTMISSPSIPDSYKRQMTPNDLLRASAPTPAPTTTTSSSGKATQQQLKSVYSALENNNNNNNNRGTVVAVPRQPSGSMNTSTNNSGTYYHNTNNVNTTNSSSSFNSGPMSPIVSVEPEMLLIEVAGKLMKELASACTSNSQGDQRGSHHFSSAASSFVSNAIERRLAKLPIIIQEKAVGAWSRAIAEGYDIRKSRSGNHSSGNNTSKATLDAILADRDELLVHLRNSKQEIEDLKKQLRLQEQAIALTGTNNNNNNNNTATTRNEDNNNNQEQELIVSVDEDDDEAQQKMMSAASDGENYSPTRVQNIADNARNNDEETLATEHYRPESVTPDVAYYHSQQQEQEKEKQSAAPPTNAAEQEGEKDPGQFLKDEIQDEEDDEGDDIDDKFQSNRQNQQQQPQHRNFTHRYNNNNNNNNSKKEEVTTTQQETEQQQYLNVDVSPTNASEKSDSLTPLPYVRTIASPPEPEQQPQSNNNNNNTNVSPYQQNRQSSFWSASERNSSKFDGVTRPALNAHQQQQLPSARPLSATLRKIMQDTTDDERNKMQAGTQSVFISHLPLEDQPVRNYSNNNNNNNNHNNDTHENDAINKPNPKTRRVGIVYSDPALSHLPGGQRGTKSFLVPDPPDVLDIINAASRALMISHVHLAVGYWAQDGITPVCIREDHILQKYLHDQPRVVPFVQCFVIGKDKKNNGAGLPLYENNASQQQGAGTTTTTSSRGFDRQQISSNMNGGYRPSRPMSAPTAARPQSSSQYTSTNHLPHNNISQQRSSSQQGSSFYNHLEGDFFVPSASASASHQQNNNNAIATTSYRRRQMFSNTNFVSTLDNSKRGDEQSVVCKNEHSERGLEVLPPKPSEESKSSPWRLRLDSTPPPVHSAVASRKIFGNNNTSTTSSTLYSSSNHQNQSQQNDSSMTLIRDPNHSNSNNNSNHHHTFPDSIADTSVNWEPLYRKNHHYPHSSLSRPVSATSNTARNNNNNYNNTSMTTQSVDNTSISRSSNTNVATIVWGGAGAPKSVTLMGGGVNEDEFDQLFEELCNEAGTDPESEGVPPSVLLRYLDRNFDHMGDQRRFERLIGSYFCRSKLTRNELTLIMLKMAKE